MAPSIADLSTWTLTVAPQVLIALGLLLAGLWLAGRAERALSALLERNHVVDLTFRGVLSTLVRYGILLVALIAAMQQLGIQTTSILAAVGAVFVAIGLALQGTLSNLAAGMMLLWLRPFRVGDRIETVTVAGTVVDVGLFATEVHRADGVYVFVPNMDLWNKPVANLSRRPARRIALRFPIGKAVDLDSARRSLLQAAATLHSVHASPPPTAAVSDVTDGGVVLTLSVWTDSAQAERVASELAQHAARALKDVSQT